MFSSRGFICLSLCLLLISFNRVNAAPPNVLFIAIDDMNHWVGHLGRNPQTKTPNIDRLAKMGVAFSKAYCTAPSCNPSRASLMSGLRPSSTGCYDNKQDWKPAISENQLLNYHFKQAGYRVYGAGKIYHGGFGVGESWDDYFKKSDGGLKRHPSAKNDGVGGIKFYPLDNDDEDMPDYQVASYGIDKMNEQSDKPFFLAVGFVKPHMPFSVPKKYFDMFPLESIQLPPYRADDLDDVPVIGKKYAGAEGDHAKILESGRWKEAVQAYLASIAFCDAQVGRLLDALEKSPAKDNTIICLWSDHGWSLGEKSHWRKFALWEEPTRTVFIWKAPGMTKPGTICDRPVDYASVFPTLCTLTGLSKPSHLEGHDIATLVLNPNAEWNHPAITTWLKDCHAIRTDDWRYIHYADGGEELYNHKTDPLEYTNVADIPDNASLKAQLKAMLPTKNAANLPRSKDGGEEESKPEKVKKKNKDKAA
jgi:arylsulfatase A-like enzyme